jgi:mono/diheme cytochrome c family protein
MLKKWLVQPLIAGLLSGPAFLMAQDVKFDPADVDRGKRLYTSYCARCHGLNMVSSGAGFFDLRQFPADDKKRFVGSVANGIRAMPAWSSQLKPEEIDLLWAYVVGSRKK